MKIGIMTFFRPINYGAYLQAYALSHRLNQESDITAEIIDFHMPEEDNFYRRETKVHKNLPRVLFNRKRFQAFRASLSQQILSEESCCSNEISQFISFVDGKYDIIIAGSDEVWDVNAYRGFPTPYFLPGELHCKKVAYAVSGRTPFDRLSDSDKELLHRYLDDFAYIGVRDEATARNVCSLMGDSDRLHRNFDPTFVYDFEQDKENGRRLLKKYYGCSGRKKVIAVMYKERNQESPSLCRYLKDTYGDQYEFISIYQWNYGMKKYPALTPLAWKDVIAAVDGVISMYFHGICFSVFAGTPFLAIEKRAGLDEESKLYDLLHGLGQMDRYSLGLNAALQEKKIERFTQEVSDGVRLDFTDAVGQAREAFSSFVDELRIM